VSRVATPAVSLPDVPGGSVTDGFNGGGANQLGRQWIEGAGNFSADSVLTNSTNLAMASLRMAQKDVSVSAKVNVKAGDETYSGLVARRTGPGLQNYYYADITGTGGVVTARIFLNYLGTFYRLDDAVLPSGDGTLRFEVVDNEQKLFFTPTGGTEKLVAFA